MDRIGKGKVHRERAQPSRRASRYPLLEKHKDYVLRARDFAKKKKRLNLLREKVAEKNPDEFYFAMTKAKLRRGKHTISQEPRKLHAHDVEYVRYARQKELSAAQRLAEQLHFVGNPPANKHIVFVEDDDEIDVEANSKKFLEFVDGVKVKNSRHSEQEGISTDRHAKATRLAYDQLARREERKEVLDAMARELETQRSLSGKGRRRQLRKGDETQPAIYVWKKERKR